MTLDFQRLGRTYLFPGSLCSLLCDLCEALKASAMVWSGAGAVKAVVDSRSARSAAAWFDDVPVAPVDAHLLTYCIVRTGSWLRHQAFARRAPSRAPAIVKYGRPLKLVGQGCLLGRRQISKSTFGGGLRDSGTVAVHTSVSPAPTGRLWCQPRFEHARLRNSSTSFYQLLGIVTDQEQLGMSAMNSLICATEQGRDPRGRDQAAPAGSPGSPLPGSSQSGMSAHDPEKQGLLDKAR